MPYALHHSATTLSYIIIAIASIHTVVGDGVGILQVMLKLLVQVFTDSNVLEHALQLGRVLEATRLLFISQQNEFTVNTQNRPNGWGEI